MYIELLPHLQCLACRAMLDAQVSATAPDGEIVDGSLVCVACGAAYPIRDGIADFLGPPSPPNPAQLVNEWQMTAWAYERLWRPFALTLLSGERFPFRRELPLMAGLAGVERGGLFVDVACSNGLYARALTRLLGWRGHVVGIDHALPMLAEARRRAQAARLRISYLRAEAQALPIAADAAAGVVIGGSLNEIGDLDACLAEAQRVLAPEGRFVTMTLARAVTARGRALQDLLGSGGVAFCTPEDLIAHVRRQGLRPAGLWRYGVVLFTLCVKRNA